MVDWESTERADTVTQTDKCAFCGHPSQAVLIRTSDGKTVPVCRQCVPKRKRLSWAENPTLDTLEATRVLANMQKAKVDQ